MQQFVDPILHQLAKQRVDSHLAVHSAHRTVFEWSESSQSAKTWYSGKNSARVLTYCAEPVRRKATPQGGKPRVVGVSHHPFKRALYDSLRICRCLEDKRVLAATAICRSRVAEFARAVAFVVVDAMSFGVILMPEFANR